jgi:glutamine synthetase
VLPAGERQLELSATAALRFGDTSTKPTALGDRVKHIAGLLNDVVASAEKLKTLLNAGDHAHDEAALARRLADEVRPAMVAAREAADRLEHVVDDDMWSIPKYREMLFVK